MHFSIVDALAGGGAYFFRQLSDAVGSTDDRAMSAALWELAWSGRIGNDTLAPLRALVGTGRRPASPARRPPPRTRTSGRPGRPAMPTRSGPAETAGRWFLLPDLEADATRRAHAVAEGMLERHGVVTRGAAVSERVPGGFAAVYKVLSAFEESGRCRRGYFVAGLGAAQFGGAGAVDRLRALAKDDARPGDKPDVVTLAATDPANPYGAALPWPEAGEGGHRPGRKAGALVVLVDGRLVVYVERGGRTLLTFDGPADGDTDELLSRAFDDLAGAVRRGALGRLTVEQADGETLLGSGDRSTALRRALESAGFVATPRGLEAACLRETRSGGSRTRWTRHSRATRSRPTSGCPSARRLRSPGGSRRPCRGASTC